MVTMQACRYEFQYSNEQQCLFTSQVGCMCTQRAGKWAVLAESFEIEPTQTVGTNVYKSCDMGKSYVEAVVGCYEKQLAY